MREPPNPLARNSKVPQRQMYEITTLYQSSLVIYWKYELLCTKIQRNYETRVHADVFAFVFPQTEVTSPTDSEDRTPGRLQAVWPPPKPKDEEEKVGLKYTEAGKKRLVISTPLSVYTSKIRIADRRSCLSSFTLTHLTLIGSEDKGQCRYHSIYIVGFLDGSLVKARTLKRK